MIDINTIKIAVISKLKAVMIQDNEVFINGDDEIIYDFNFIENIVKREILSAHVSNVVAKNQVYNVAVGGYKTLNTLFNAFQESLRPNDVYNKHAPVYLDFHIGELLYSQGDIGEILKLLGYEPQIEVIQGGVKRCHVIQSL